MQLFFLHSNKLFTLAFQLVTQTKISYNNNNNNNNSLQK